jgi:hypothetical protein
VPEAVQKIRREWRGNVNNDFEVSTFAAWQPYEAAANDKKAPLPYN